MAVAAISGAATEGSATGAPMADRLLRGGLAAAVTAAAAMAPTWAVVVLAIGAAGLGWSGELFTATSGASALGLAVLLVWKDDGGRHLLKAAIGGLAITALLRVPGGQLGATGAATAVLTALIALTALGGAGPRRRRRAVLALAGLLGLGAVASALGALAGLSARSSFERSSTGVGAALDSARTGDAPAAAESARTAAGDLTLARSSLRAWWSRPAWAVPVVGAHLRAADRVAASAGPAVYSGRVVRSAGPPARRPAARRPAARTPWPREPMRGSPDTVSSGRSVMPSDDGVALSWASTRRLGAGRPPLAAAESCSSASWTLRVSS